MTVAILTAIYDDYDTLKPTLKQSVDVEWICVTDNRYCHTDDWESKGWNIVYEPRPHLQPNRAAKTPKCLPWLYTDASSSIWIDASYQVTSPTFAEDVLSYANPIAQFRHPWRDCVYDEAAESLKLAKYKSEYSKIVRQVEELRFRDHPPHWGLWATGVIARHHTPEVVDAGLDWFADIYNYSFQDQISWPDVVRRHDVCPLDLPGTHLANQWLSYQGSVRH